MKDRVTPKAWRRGQEVVEVSKSFNNKQEEKNPSDGRDKNQGKDDSQQNGHYTSTLIDFAHENEPDISTYIPQATISEIWGQYPHKPVCQVEWDKAVSDISDNVAELNPYVKFKKPGEEISAVEAINWTKNQFGQVDFRPKIYDSVTKTYTLCDTGAMISCIPREKGDKLDPKTKLRTASGTPMNTYGTKEISIRLGRKTYTITATITDVTQRILGMDFFHKYQLGFQWIYDDLFVIDFVDPKNLKSI